MLYLQGDERHPHRKMVVQTSPKKYSVLLVVIFKPQECAISRSQQHRPTDDMMWGKSASSSGT